MKYIKRDLETEIAKYIGNDEIIAILGVRQCGKTTLLKKIRGDLTEAGHKSGYISFDDVNTLHLFEEDIYSFIELHVKPFEFLFIDEIQYARNSGKQLKYIFDSTEVKLFISGSSSADIAVKSIKYLAGRIFTFTLYPFSFKEFLRSKDENLIPLYESGKYKNEMIIRFNRYLREFLIYGGFPRVVLSENAEEKIFVLQNLYNVFLLREIRELFGLSDDFKFSKLLKALALQSGNMINFNELSAMTETSFFELKKYINILEKTYIAGLIPPYFTNKMTELVKSPKAFFYDTGFRNICLNNFAETVLGSGEIYELFIFSEFKKHNINPKYWRTKSKAEVDFIVERSSPVPVEIKTNVKSAKISKSLSSFLHKYRVPDAYVLSLDFEAKRISDNTRIHFFPLVKSIIMIKQICRV